MMVPTEKVAIYGYVEYEETGYERALYDIAAMFTLLKDGVVVENAIESVSFNEDKDVITELAVELAVELEAGHEYVLQFDNGAEGLDNRSSEVDIVMDDEGPVITVLLTEELTFVAGTASERQLLAEHPRHRRSRRKRLRPDLCEAHRRHRQHEQGRRLSDYRHRL
ncbi:MAG: hypothetical protein MZU97_10095 [Bacillus subtilis]|nr:hypothetical protein [Bacillus subtilis]